MRGMLPFTTPLCVFVSELELRAASAVFATLGVMLLPGC